MSVMSPDLSGASPTLAEDAHLAPPKTSANAGDHHLIPLYAICLALPEAAREDLGRHAKFTVRRRTFAYYLDDHHGDGIVALCCKAPAGENEALIAADPVANYRPAYLGPKGWLGLRLDVGAIDWDRVERLVGTSYGLVAPKRLVANWVGGSVGAIIARNLPWYAIGPSGQENHDHAYPGHIAERGQSADVGRAAATARCNRSVSHRFVH